MCGVKLKNTLVNRYLRVFDFKLLLFCFISDKIME